MKNNQIYTAIFTLFMGFALAACGSSGGGTGGAGGSFRAVTGTLSGTAFDSVNQVKAVDETGLSYTESVTITARASALTSASFSLSLPVGHYYTISFLAGDTTVSTLKFSMSSGSSMTSSRFYLSDSSTTSVDLGTIQSTSTGAATPQNNPLSQNDADNDGVNDYDDIDDDDDGLYDVDDDDYEGHTESDFDDDSFDSDDSSNDDSDDNSNDDWDMDGDSDNGSDNDSDHDNDNDHN